MLSSKNKLRVMSVLVMLAMLFSFANVSLVPTAYAAPVTLAENQSWLTWTSQIENGVWVDRTISLNTTTNIICASITSLSPFAIFDPEMIAPTANPVATPAANGTGWNNSDVTVNWNWSDEVNGSGIDNANCTTSTVSSGEGTITLNATCKDLAGNTGSASYTVKVDKTHSDTTITNSPVGQSSSNVASFAFSSNESNATFECGIDFQPFAACSSPSDYNSLADGSHTFAVRAIDQAGNIDPTPASFTWTIKSAYTFSGFFQPVDNLLTLNSANAGQAIPVKFSLAGNQGLSIFAAGYPLSQKIACDSSLPLDDIEETVTTGNSSLSYDADSNQYNYVWKTDKAWAGTQCH